MKIKSTTSRRRFLGAAALGLAAPAILTRTRAYADTPKLKIGHVGPRPQADLAARFRALGLL